ncbi:MAG TPA: hypothetical protein VGX25_35410 [Actinophytocola sp.]|uniref:hypothetical protein n=1 Tax=Actinophytocola sp. TaxID=1872138 RepID=UPI002DDD45DE|nr:hypothetical protein [Actinophytocola sp.]HEV2784703.1 hypothetical protein [Actinophytocola sp.]
MVEVPPGSVVITPTELYKEMQGIDSKVDDIRADLKAVLPMVPDHETRIRALEKRMWVMAGAATVLGGGLGKLISVWTGG